MQAPIIQLFHEERYKILMKKYLLWIILIISVIGISGCKKNSPEDVSNPDTMEIKDSENEYPIEFPPLDLETEEPEESVPVSVDLDTEIEEHLENLTKHGSRKWGTESEHLAANYIKEKMELYGYHVDIQEVPAYEYDIRATGSGDYFNINPYNSERIGTAYNVIADNKVSQDTDKIVVLSAHYDTVSKELGIIDNTSGVITLLEVAHLLANTELPFKLRFIFFSTEERFMLGSKYYVSNLSNEELERIAACINVDMVGYKDGQEIIVATPHFVSTTGGGPHALDGVGNTLTDEWHKLFPEYEGYVRGEPNSDHLSFDRKGIPSMMITQRYFDMETARKKDSDYENLSIPELKTTIDLICKYIESLDLTKIKYE